MPESHSLTTLEIVGLLGSIASIVSIVINVVQGLANHSLKSALDSAVCIGENAAAEIERDAETALKGHPAKHTEFLKSILAHARSTRAALSQMRRRQLDLKSRK
jgi:hypothetical protein